MSGCTYAIVPFSDMTQDMIDVCFETSFATLRHTTEGDDLVVLKWDGPMPSELDGYTCYNHTQILVEMQKPEWNEVESSSMME
jgi:hypothetical protein